jgi:hypothetical protein
MSSSPERSRLDRLLRELYVKKYWLDTMIAGLESATQSADHQFIESVERVLGDLSFKKPTVDLRDRQRAKLARLAQQLGRKGPRRRRPDVAAQDPQ